MAPGPDAQSGRASPVVHVVGLGPGGPDLVTQGTLDLIGRIDVQFLRTERHPAAVVMPDAQWFDRVYDTAETIESVYTTIAVAVARAARANGEVLYAVPGSPVVAEQTVQHLLADGDIDVVVHPAMSFLDLAWARLGVDPLLLGAHLVDGYRFAEMASGLSGPVLVAQCDSRFILSDIKLVDDEPRASIVTVLHHLGLDDEQIFDVHWDDLDRGFEPDHLTSLWIPDLEPSGRASSLRRSPGLRRRGLWRHRSR